MNARTTLIGCLVILTAAAFCIADDKPKPQQRKGDEEIVVVFFVEGQDVVALRATDDGAMQVSLGGEETGFGTDEDLRFCFGDGLGLGEARVEVHFEDRRESDPDEVVLVLFE